MMNQTLQDLKTRRSCRRYRPEQIKESELEQAQNQYNAGLAHRHGYAVPEDCGCSG